MLFYCFVDPRVLHSFPTRRSSDLREAGRAGGTAPAVLNAANEVAVGAFLAGGIRFTDIPAVVEHALDRVPIETVRALRSEEHTSELQSHVNLVCRLLLEKKKKRHG